MPKGPTAPIQNSHTLAECLFQILSTMEYPGAKVPGISSLQPPKGNEFTLIVDGQQFTIKVEPR